MTGLIAAAGNLRGGDNPPYTLDDFRDCYPQFAGDVVPESMLEMYLELAHEAVREARWHKYWRLGMGLFIAHFATLWVQGTAEPGSGAAGILDAGELQGLPTSFSAGGVSDSVDYGAVVSGLDGWAAWNMTTYGVQLATIAKMVGKGGMLVW